MLLQQLDDSILEQMFSKLPAHSLACVQSVCLHWCASSTNTHESYWVAGMQYTAWHEVLVNAVCTSAVCTFCIYSKFTSLLCHPDIQPGSYVAPWCMASHDTPAVGAVCRYTLVDQAQLWQQHAQPVSGHAASSSHSRGAGSRSQSGYSYRDICLHR